MCYGLVKEKMEEIGAGKDHGIEHIIKVLENTRKGFSTSQFADQLNSNQVRSMYLAALLHEVDDRKLTSTNDYENAREILAKLNRCYPGYINTELVIKMVDLVSCSKNGNHCPDDIPIWMLFPRAADRLEAIGKIGTDRCVEYSESINTPLYVRDTPLSLNVNEIMKFANPERFSNYITSGGKSVSIIDHHYDKLLHINRLNLPEIIASKYFTEKSAKAFQETISGLKQLIKRAMLEYNS